MISLHCHLIQLVEGLLFLFWPGDDILPLLNSEWEWRICQTVLCTEIDSPRWSQPLYCAFMTTCLASSSGCGLVHSSLAKVEDFFPSHGSSLQDKIKIINALKEKQQSCSWRGRVVQA